MFKLIGTGWGCADQRLWKPGLFTPLIILLCLVKIVWVSHYTLICANQTCSQPCLWFWPSLVVVEFREVPLTPLAGYLHASALCIISNMEIACSINFSSMFKYPFWNRQSSLKIQSRISNKDGTKTGNFPAECVLRYARVKNVWHDADRSHNRLLLSWK